MNRHDLVTRLSAYGHPAGSQEDDLPRIPDGYLDAVIYLYRSVKDAETGVHTGGSGFLIAQPLARDSKRSFTIAVTNRHVIEDGCSVVRLNNRDGSTHILDIEERAWLMPDDGSDLAVFPLPVDREMQKLSQISRGALLSQAELGEKNIGIGDEVFLIGRFIGNDGRQTNVPTVRFGNIAQMPTVLTDDYGREQESFLVEVRSVGGYSGSPVLVHIAPLSFRPEGRLGQTPALHDGYWGPALLGVNWCHPTYKETVLDVSGRESLHKLRVHAHTGLAGVIPAWRLNKLLDHPELRRILKEAEDRYWLEAPMAVTDAIEPSDED